MIVRVPAIAEDSFAAIRALNRLGIAIAAMMSTMGMNATPAYPNTNPAIASPCPVSRPALFFMSERQMAEYDRNDRKWKKEEKQSEDQARYGFAAGLTRGRTNSRSGGDGGNL